MALGLGVLGLAPHALWALTPRELDAMLRGRFGPAVMPQAMSHHDLAQLMMQFPD